MTIALRLPGFNLPFDFSPTKNEHGQEIQLFPSALNLSDDDSDPTVLPLTTLRELTMLQIMNYLTDKKNWQDKASSVHDPEIVKKWVAEAIALKDKDITESTMTFCIDELRYKTRAFAETGCVTVFNGDVVKSDIAVPVDLMNALKKAASCLEAVPESKKDWHPGSDGKVLDLVHPSLFPLVYGRTRILPDSVLGLTDCFKRSCEGVAIPVPDTVNQWRLPFNNQYSRRFQWLPCEVDLSADFPKITSYINNLHPQRHADLYRIIEQVIGCAIPLWNITLAPLAVPGSRPSWFKRIDYRGCYEEEVVQPEPGLFSPPTPHPPLDLRLKYIDSGLQIIVKLANIELTPTKPRYEGGSWHVEGQLNEHICATALYYYANENITTSKLTFRQQSDVASATGMYYEQDDHAFLPAVFGCHQGGPGVQVVGGVKTIEGRLLTFPNILQHQVQPFELVDPSKPGHRKILALFLIDPNRRIISTANVPPQQRDWWREAVAGTPGHSFGKLPVELQRHICDLVEEFPISLDDAKEIRLELMEERKKFVVDQRIAFESLEFSLCEH